MPSFRNELFVPSKDQNTVKRELSFGKGQNSEKNLEKVTSPVLDNKKFEINSMMDNSMLSQKATDHNTSFMPASCFSKVSDEVLKGRASQNLKENSTPKNRGSQGVFTPMSGFSQHKNKISDTYSDYDPLMPNRNQGNECPSSSFHTHSSFYEYDSSDREWYQAYKDKQAKKNKEKPNPHIDLLASNRNLMSPKSFNYHLGADSNTPLSGGQKSGSDLLFTPQTGPKLQVQRSKRVRDFETLSSDDKAPKLPKEQQIDLLRQSSSEDELPNNHTPIIQID